MPFNRQSASQAGKSSKRGRAIATKEIKKNWVELFKKSSNQLK